MKQITHQFTNERHTQIIQICEQIS